ncbi:MAG: DUF5011 domain-containing protein [Campylobacterota bacterium]|nr:DUF5011 domain-containing protein [Campylobacterota bacterium]
MYRKQMILASILVLSLLSEVMAANKVKDMTAPVITLNGEAIEHVVQFSEYADKGATAYDEVDGEVNVRTKGRVNTNRVGRYKIRYIARDKARNRAKAVRIVKVIRASKRHYTKPIESEPKNWYMRFMAEDLERGLKVENVQLGVLDEEDADVKHSLKALGTFGATYLDIVFENPEDLDGGDYKTHFQTYAMNETNGWTMTVKTDESDATITLGWRGLYLLTPYRDVEDRLRYNERQVLTHSLLKQMKLVDTVNGEEVPAVMDGEFISYTFEMDGAQKRIFEWIVPAYVLIEEGEAISATPYSMPTTHNKSINYQKSIKAQKRKEYKKRQKNKIRKQQKKRKIDLHVPPRGYLIDERSK